MAHDSQQRFCQEKVAAYPELFRGKRVLDVGSRDVNGNNRYLFEDCRYIGIDISEGPNVDFVCPAMLMTGTYDVIISTSALEHDPLWKETLLACVKMLVPGGPLLITAAGPGWPEHGTTWTSVGDWDMTRQTHEMYKPFVDWYHNIDIPEFEEALPRDLFTVYETSTPFSNEAQGIRDFFFFGVKR